MRPRLRALDGLRGIAALVVLIHHVLLMDAGLAAPYLSPRPRADQVYVRVLTYTPLHLMWNGTVAVYVFFVLSGYVLALPAVQGRREPWSAYYPKRLVRLYLPVMAAVLLALLWMRIAPRRTLDGASWWLNAHSGPTAYGVARDMSLLLWPGVTNSALWSLRWEVLFSLLLPLFVVSMGWLRRFPAALICALLAVLASTPGAQGIGDWFVFLPMFGCGVALASCRQPIVPAGPWARWLLFGTVVLALNTSWTQYLFADAPGSFSGFLRAVEVLGACALVVIVLHVPVAHRLLTRPSPLWLGSRSFSLYLVHEPIAVSIGLLLGGRAPVLATLALTVPLSLLVAEVFFRLVERPSLGLARSAGRLAQRNAHLTAPLQASTEGFFIADLTDRALAAESVEGLPGA